MKERMFSKGLAVAVILLLCISVTPSIGISNNDDTTPPVTTHTLDPSKPDGNNGWYVSDVTVTLTATDDMSGVNVTYYRINGGVWMVYTETFNLSKDGDDILIEYYSVDYANNIENVKSFTIDIDQTEPDISLYYEVTGGNLLLGWEITFTADATDIMSGMERVEFYVNYILQETVYGAGPEYCWILQSHYRLNNPVRVRGLIFKPEITEEYVSFYAIIVRISKFLSLFDTELPYIYADAYDNAGNYDRGEIIDPINTISIEPGIYLFQNITYPNKYSGYIGRNFIFASFDISNIDW